MPYIDPKKRAVYDNWLSQVDHWLAQHGDEDGDLNYVITRLLLRRAKRQGCSYKTFNALVGVLTCVVLELYRRMIAPYEMRKCAESGDVYEEEG